MPKKKIVASREHNNHLNNKTMNKRIFHLRSAQCLLNEVVPENLLVTFSLVSKEGANIDICSSLDDTPNVFFDDLEIESAIEALCFFFKDFDKPKPILKALKLN